MKQIQAGLALALLLLTGLNCGEDPYSSFPDPVTGTVRGEVQAIDGVWFQVRLENGGVSMQIETRDAYEFPNVVAGTVTIQISAKGYETKEVIVPVAVGQVVSLDKVALVELTTPVSHLRCVVTDKATGEPLYLLRVFELQLTDKAGKVYQAWWTGAGDFTFRNLPVEQAFTLTIDHEDYEGKEVAVPPIPAAETLELVVELTPLTKPERLPGQGLSVNTPVPAFKLPDGNGKLHALADYVGNENVVLIFYRGGW